jgi:pimeloyl-ACP methyl ester carboxylesterase
MQSVQATRSFLASCAAMCAVLWCVAAGPARAEGSAFEGVWIGATTGERVVDLVLVVETKDGKLIGQAALPSFGTLGDPVPDLAEKDGHLTGTISAMVGTMKFNLARAGEAADGTLSALPPGSPTPIEMPLHLERTIEARGSKEARAWAGQLEAGAQSIVMGLVIAPNGADRWAGAIDIPAQRIRNLPLRVARAADGTFTIHMPIQGNATFVLREADGKLSGEYSQGKFKAPIEFAPHDDSKQLPAAKPRPRPQDPQPPFPYDIRIQRIGHPSGHTLEGTLLVPKTATKEKPVPAVLLVTGSGQQDRDESIMGHRPFAVLADALARRGIAVLRCDDRGIGGSDGDFAAATTDDFVSDAMYEFVTLAAVEQVDRCRVGIVGHSEGGLVAPMAAVKLSADKDAPSSPAFLVLMAGTGVNGDAILREQNTKLLRASGLTEEQIAPVRAAHAAFLDAVKQGADPVVLKARARELVTAQLKLGGMDMTKVPDTAIDQQADGALQQVNSPWMKRFLALDPAEALRQVSCPVMVLNGTLDAQVSTEQNVPAIEAALKEAAAKDPRTQATVKVMPGLNHLFQPAKTGSLEEYTTIDTTMSPEVLDAIAAWVLAQPSRNLPPLPKPAPGAAPVGMPVPMPIPVPVPVPPSK